MLESSNKVCFTIAMTKKEAVKIFGKTQVDLAKALGKTKSAISQWDDVLTIDQVRIVIGEAVISGTEIPKFIKENVFIGKDMGA